LGATLPTQHRQITAPKSQPPNPGREIFRHRVEETTGKNVSAAKKIARDAKKVPEIRAKPDNVRRHFYMLSQLLSCWLGHQDSNLGLPRESMYLKCRENWPRSSENKGGETLPTNPARTLEDRSPEDTFIREFRFDLDHGALTRLFFRR
jgi:hypothetical protein